MKSLEMYDKWLGLIRKEILGEEFVLKDLYLSTKASKRVVFERKGEYRNTSGLLVNDRHEVAIENNKGTLFISRYYGLHLPVARSLTDSVLECIGVSRFSMTRTREDDVLAQIENKIGDKSPRVQAGIIRIRKRFDDTFEEHFIIS